MTQPDSPALPPRAIPSGAIPLGATPLANQSEPTTNFQVWAPTAKKVSVEIVSHDGQRENLIDKFRLRRGDNGVFSIKISDAPAGTLYRYSIDNQPGRPDPRSMFQPFGVHGPSQVVDHAEFQWQDAAWTGVAKRDLVIYELHIGSFTTAGTYEAAIERLDDLVELGITAVEILPLAQSPGRWNWGYDCVNYFAPRNTFGTPEQLKQFVDACHQRGLAVFNDVIYNHVGPEGNYLSDFGPYGSKKHGTPWGDALNFDGPDNQPVRQFVTDNVLFWLDDYHFDGLRLDAVHYMFDDSSQHILSEIQQRFRQHQAGLDRKTYLIGEANIYDPDLVGAPADANKHYDAIWSDCLMHSIIAIGDSKLRLTDRHYQQDDLAETLQHAYLYTAPQAIRMTPKRRKLHHPTGDRRFIESLITALQTHDSVGNHPQGKRLHHLTDVDFQKSAAPLILLYPSIPMIFMGEEVASDARFPFFADFEDAGLRKAVDRGRRDEYPHHDWKGSPLPSDTLAFTSSVVKPELENASVKSWYQQLLSLRKLGIAAGWLAVDTMTTTADVQNHVYQISYRLGSEEFLIACRLDKTNAAPVAIEAGQELLADSWANLPTGTLSSPSTTSEIQPRQCLIWRSSR